MPEFILLVLSKIWGTLLAMAPYLMIGFGVAGLLSVFISSAWVERR